MCKVAKECFASELLLIIRGLSNMGETEFYSAKLCSDWGAYLLLYWQKTF